MIFKKLLLRKSIPTNRKHLKQRFLIFLYFFYFSIDKIIFLLYTKRMYFKRKRMIVRKIYLKSFLKGVFKNEKNNYVFTLRFYTCFNGYSSFRCFRRTAY